MPKLEKLQPLDDPANAQGSSYDSGWYGYVDKDLRALLGKPVLGRFARQYCGAGVLAVCQASIWAALDAAGNTLAAAQGPDPAQWHSERDGRADPLQRRPAAGDDALDEPADLPAGDLLRLAPSALALPSGSWPRSAT